MFSGLCGPWPGQAGLSESKTFRRVPSRGFAPLLLANVGASFGARDRFSLALLGVTLGRPIDVAAVRSMADLACYRP
jgi:hypothetical protein